MTLLDLRSSTHLAPRSGIRPPRPYATVLFVVAAIVAVTAWGLWG
jgi:hypothetical protein